MRYLPLSEKDRAQMCDRIGVESTDELFASVPRSVYYSEPFPGMPLHKGELEIERELTALAGVNLSCGRRGFLGGGAYRHHLPATVDTLIQRGEFLTSYTPYQPEITQGTLQYLFEFQTQVALLTGMEIANASLYDGASGCGEGVMMANRLTKRRRALISGGLHPHYREVVETGAYLTGFEVVVQAPDVHDQESLEGLIDDTFSCVVVQTPSFFGHLRDFLRLGSVCHEHGVLLIVVVTEVISLGLLTPPGEMGADIVVAEGQSIGNSLSFGGPYVGLFATRQKFVRQMPGRVVGQASDVDGQPGYVLTLSAREQHIRRENATSNICTNSGLCALGFTIHLSLLGETGLRRLAELNHVRAVRLAGLLDQVEGVRVLNRSFFNEMTVELPCSAEGLIEGLVSRSILGGIPLSRLYPGDRRMENLLLIAITEINTEEEMEELCREVKALL